VRQMKGGQRIMRDKNNLVQNGEPGMTDEVKKILIVSDSDKLARALELNLKGRWCVVKTHLISSLEQSPAKAADYHLIVIAMSLPSSEPVVALAKASLGKHLGQIPILIISDRPFRSAPGESIHHLNFPFTPEALYAKVQEILDPSAITSHKVTHKHTSL